MRKVLILIFCLFLTGCSVVRIDTTNVDNIVKVILSKENNLYNHVGRGYKYYVPKGVSYIETIDLNERLYSNGVNYYLYIDTVSYFYKINTNYEEKKDLYYSKVIDGDKEGYLEIKEQNGMYYITFYYNYAKIEAVTDKKHIEEVVLNSSYILSTIKFNDNIVELSLNDDYLTNKEEKYLKFMQKESQEYFLVSSKDEEEQNEIDNVNEEIDESNKKMEDN